jgi:hypothetical protein
MAGNYEFLDRASSAVLLARSLPGWPCTMQAELWALAVLGLRRFSHGSCIRPWIH